MENNGGIGKVIIISFVIIWAISFLIPLSMVVGPYITEISPVFFVFAIIIVLGIWFAVIYNKFIHLAQKVNQSAGTIDVYLKQRFDLIPNLVETVKAYAKYEENILRNIAELRVQYANNNNENLAISAELNNKYNQLLAVIENYPELKANENFLNLQKQLSKVESQLQAARRIYNTDVTAYNTKVHSVPSNIVAKIFGFKEMALFEIVAHERENININI